MNGSNKPTSRKPSGRDAILEAMKAPPPGGYYVWDGKDPEDRPLTREQMKTGAEAARKLRGRPPGSTKESTTIRIDKDVLEAFREAGPGWQSRINAVLRDWLKTHKAA